MQGVVSGHTKNVKDSEKYHLPKDRKFRTLVHKKWLSLHSGITDNFFLA